jgi:hypothetical protein
LRRRLHSCAASRLAGELGSIASMATGEDARPPLSNSLLNRYGHVRAGRWRSLHAGVAHASPGNG